MLAQAGADIDVPDKLGITPVSIGAIPPKQIWTIPPNYGPNHLGFLLNGLNNLNDGPNHLGLLGPKRFGGTAPNRHASLLEHTPCQSTFPPSF